MNFTLLTEKTVAQNQLFSKSKQTFLIHLKKRKDCPSCPFRSISSPWHHQSQYSSQQTRHRIWNQRYSSREDQGLSYRLHTLGPNWQLGHRKAMLWYNKSAVCCATRKYHKSCTFHAYIIPLSDICRKPSLSYHICADDTQLYIAFKPLTVTINEYIISLACMHRYIDKTWKWICINMQTLNEEKSNSVCNLCFHLD